MTQPSPVDDASALDVRMFRGSSRFGRALPLLRRLPPSVSTALLVGLSLGDGVVRGRFSSAMRWAAAQSCDSRAGRVSMAAALLANHGRYAAEEAMLHVRDPRDVGADAVVRGAEFLGGGQRGTLLLGFHLGPPRNWLVLRNAGYRVRMVARFETMRDDPRWKALVASGDAIRLPPDGPADRAAPLYRVRSLLAQNAIFYMTADGPFGREAFRLDLPGNPLRVRAGWMSLRRHLGVRTLPVLGHEEGSRRVVEIYPPLPPVSADPEEDIEACRAALLPLMADYVRRYPTQCRWLAFPRWVS